MIASIFYICFGLSSLFLIVLIRLIRRRLLREQYSLMWLILSLLMMLLSLFPKSLDTLAGLMRVSYAPSLLYILAIVGILFILLHLTLAVSALAERTIAMAQSLAIYEERLRRMQSVGNHGDPDRY